MNEGLDKYQEWVDRALTAEDFLRDSFNHISCVCTIWEKRPFSKVHCKHCVFKQSVKLYLNKIK